MTTYKAKYSNGTVQLLEQLPKQLALKDQDVRVQFFDDEPEKKKIPSIPASRLLKLAGIVSLGGDAVKDKKALYDR